MFWFPLASSSKCQCNWLFAWTCRHFGVYLYFLVLTSPTICSRLELRKNMNLTLLIRYICNPFIPVDTISIYIPNILYFVFIFPHCQSTLIGDGHVFYMKFNMACYWNVSIRSRRACLSICHLCNQTKFPYSIWW